MTDSPKAHGVPFGAEEVRATKEILGLPPDETFWVPDDVLAFYRQASARGQRPRSLGEAAGARSRGAATARGGTRPGAARACPAASEAADLEGRANRSPPAHAINACLNAVPRMSPAWSRVAPT